MRAQSTTKHSQVQGQAQAQGSYSDLKSVSECVPEVAHVLVEVADHARARAVEGEVIGKGIGHAVVGPGWLQRTDKRENNRAR